MGRKRKTATVQPAAGGKTPPPSPDDPELAHIAPALRPFARLISELRVDPRNINSHGEASLAAIAAALGVRQQKPIVLWPDGSDIVCAGNGMLQAARDKQGWKWIAAVAFDGTMEEARKFHLADNRSAQLSHLDDALLIHELAWLKSSDAGLYDSLLLMELESGTPPASKPIEVVEVFGIYVELATEEARQGLLERLKRDGFDAKKMTL